MTQTTKPQMTQFREIGRQAFHDGGPRAPILNSEVQAAIAGLPVGGAAAAIMREYSRGWSEALDAAIALGEGTEAPAVLAVHAVMGRLDARWA